MTFWRNHLLWCGRMKPATSCHVTSTQKFGNIDMIDLFQTSSFCLQLPLLALVSWWFKAPDLGDSGSIFVRNNKSEAKHYRVFIIGSHKKVSRSFWASATSRVMHEMRWSQHQWRSEMARMRIARMLEANCLLQNMSDTWREFPFAHVMCTHTIAVHVYELRRGAFLWGTPVAQRNMLGTSCM